MSEAAIVEMEALSDGEERRLMGRHTVEKELFSCKKGREEEEEGKMARTEKKEK